MLTSEETPIVEAPQAIHSAHGEEAANNAVFVDTSGQMTMFNASTAHLHEQKAEETRAFMSNQHHLSNKHLA